MGHKLTASNSKEVESGFTLIELIIVMAILALLAALLFPVFMRSKQKSLDTVNLQNLGQLGKGLILYAADNDDVIPTWWETAFNATNGIPDLKNPAPKDVWDGKLVPYVGQGNSPEHEGDLDRSGVWHSPKAEEPTSVRSYGINQMAVFRWKPGPKGEFQRMSYAWRHLSMSSVTEPSRIISLGDGGREGRLAPSINWDGWSDLYDKKLGYYRREAPWRYEGKASYLFFDGHAAYMDGHELFPSPRLVAPGKLSSIDQVFGMGHCAMAKWFVPLADEADWHRSIAKESVECQ